MRSWALLLSVLLGLPGSAAVAGELSLSFPDLERRGQVSVAVFRNGEDWSRRRTPVWAEIVKVGDVPLRLTRTLPPGEYAVMAYHDLNANGRLDTLPVGLPTEPYGFSNGSRGVFGPPDWRAAKFRLAPSGSDQVMRLR